MKLLRYNQEPVEIDVCNICSICAGGNYTMEIVMNDGQRFVGYCLD